MSRTYRRMPYRYHRRPKTTQIKKQETKSVDMMMDFGYNPSNRAVARSNPKN